MSENNENQPVEHVLESGDNYQQNWALLEWLGPPSTTMFATLDELASIMMGSFLGEDNPLIKVLDIYFPDRRTYEGPLIPAGERIAAVLRVLSRIFEEKAASPAQAEVRLATILTLIFRDCRHLAGNELGMLEFVATRLEECVAVFENSS